MTKSRFEIQDIGVVIPTYNEALYLPELLADLNRIGFVKVCIVDAGSTDKTAVIAENHGIVNYSSEKKNRAFQLNLGAKQLQAKFYLFIHADVRFTDLNEEFILGTINSNSFTFGNFKLRFDSSHWFLKLNEKFSHFKLGAFQFGDQGLLIKSDVFELANGYNENLLFMEGNDIIRRLRQNFTFIKMNQKLIVSARKYEAIGVYSLQFSYFLIYFLTRLGIPQNKVKQRFKKVFGLG